ncbi:hypothetical protein EHS25_003269 [Saitozyma podzolica]|uniref:Transcription factor IIIC 90kDa subunit N-terminal domain-containing protein n=1 Tax=Saitozyma podzolica TaxID=1890683 RepID=A0A427Y8B3_9TREE|nr:hypothetical protein EHS25_003269 [Saitozyma podzolica]
MDVPPPTVLTLRTFAGIIPSTTYGHVAWNDDGQCLFLTTRAVIILTPHIGTCLPPPASLIDLDLSLEHPTQGASKAKPRTNFGLEGTTASGLDEDGDVDMDGARPGGKEDKLPRPTGGEVPTFVNGVEIPLDRARDDVYGWNDVGAKADEIRRTQRLSLHRRSYGAIRGLVTVRSVRLGPVSVYCPRNDPYTKKWDEIADLTALTRSLIPSEQTDTSLGIPVMLEMRSTCMEWSRAAALPGMVGVDGSLLAISNRAGKVALWSYGPERRFRRDAYLNVSEGLVNRLAWSDWSRVNDQTCEAELAIAASDGSVSLMTARQLAVSGRSWRPAARPPKVIDAGDGRGVTALTWIKGILVWTKPGSVHLWSDKRDDKVHWEGVRVLRLERVGNWAGANGIGPAVGITPLSSDQLLVTLSSLTCHLITRVSTDPSLAPMEQSLALSLSARDVSLEDARAQYLENKRRLMKPEHERAVTVYTQGFARAGDWGGVFSWAFEPANFHNLDSATDGIRQMCFALADLDGSIPGENPGLVESLEALEQGPGKVLLPYLLHLSASTSRDTLVGELADLCSVDTDTRLALEPAQGKPKSKGSSSRAGGSASTSLAADPMNSLWGPKQLDGLRLRYALATWCAARYSKRGDGWSETVQSLMEVLQMHLRHTLLRWAAASEAPEVPTSSASSLDRHFVHLLVRSVQPVSDTGSLPSVQKDLVSLKKTFRVDADGAEGPEDKCPACGEPVALVSKGGGATCSKQHEWIANVGLVDTSRPMLHHPTPNHHPDLPGVHDVPRRLAHPRTAPHSAHTRLTGRCGPRLGAVRGSRGGP